LKEPGSAYKDVPGLGSDKQVSTMAKISNGTRDNGGIHINSGIPNKAFYELAQRLRERADLAIRYPLAGLTTF
jgi:Zn-dependent metalloprotease